MHHTFYRPGQGRAIPFFAIIVRPGRGGSAIGQAPRPLRTESTAGRRTMAGDSWAPTPCPAMLERFTRN